jgi:peptidylprolyl isomerase
MRFVRVFAALMPLVVAGCLTFTEPPLAKIEETTFAPSLNVNLPSSTKTASGLYYRDLTVGTGATFAVGKVVGLYFVASLSTGVQVDSWQPSTPPDTTHTPLTFRIGDGTKNPGFDEGVRGMLVGGKRQIIVPPELAYGTRGYLNVPGNAVLVYVVDAMSAQ